MLVKVDCSGIVSSVVGLSHIRGFKGAYDTSGTGVIILIVE